MMDEWPVYESLDDPITVEIGEIEGGFEVRARAWIAGPANLDTTEIELACEARATEVARALRAHLSSGRGALAVGTSA